MLFNPRAGLCTRCAVSADRGAIRALARALRPGGVEEAIQFRSHEERRHEAEFRFDFQGGADQILVLIAKPFTRRTSCVPAHRSAPFMNFPISCRILSRQSGF